MYLTNYSSNLISEALLALLENVVTDSLLFRKSDYRFLVGCSESENVVDAGGESTALRILQVHNLERSDVLLAVGEDTNATLILSLSDDASGTSLELNHIEALASLDVESEGVVHLGERIRITDSATVVSGHIWHRLGSYSNTGDTAELELMLVGEGALLDADKQTQSVIVRVPALNAGDKRPASSSHVLCFSSTLMGRKDLERA